MNIFRLEDGIPFEQTVVTTGTFDGLHKGHRQLLNQLDHLAQKLMIPPVVVTFEPHPRMVLRPESEFGLLTTPDEKLSLFNSYGVENVVIISFDKNFASLSADRFLCEVIGGKLNASDYLLGYDHRFGHDREGGFDRYAGFAAGCGIRLYQGEAVFNNGIPVSSSAIRAALRVGDMHRVTQLLGYPYRLQGSVVGGHRIGRTIGFPTANIHPHHPRKLIPALGVYAVWATVQNRRWAGMLNIGFKPTVVQNNTIPTVEVHLIDFEGDIYGEEMLVEFVSYLRPEQRFESLDALETQLKIDRENASKALGYC